MMLAMLVVLNKGSTKKIEVWAEEMNEQYWKITGINTKSNAFGEDGMHSFKYRTEFSIFYRKSSPRILATKTLDTNPEIFL